MNEANCLNPQLRHAYIANLPISLTEGYRASGLVQRNIEDTGEFVWNLVTRQLAEAMNQTSANVPSETSEFELAHLTPVASRLVGAPRVQESPVSFECRRTQIIQLQTATGEAVPTWLVLGEVVAVHIDRRLLKDGIYDTAAAEHVLRGGGAADYFTIGAEQLFRKVRPG